MNEYTCDKCHDLGGYKFEQNYPPENFLEGKRSSEIWIIGLNPASDIGFNHSSTTVELENHFAPGEQFYSYFRDFRSVSSIVFDVFGVEGGTAHTDIVKCGSRRFPGGKIGAELAKRCSGYLHKQIVESKPRLIKCNGSPVSQYLKAQFPANADSSNTMTSYWTAVDGIEVCVVLSGFIGRINNFARRRLGVEIETRLEHSKIRRSV